MPSNREQMKNRVAQFAQRKAIVQSSIGAVILWSVLLLMPISALTQEQSFPLPSTTGAVGKKDPGALTEIKAHLLTVSAAGWQDLQATGTLTYPDGNPHPATLFLMGSRYSRLDIEMGSGVRSLRLSGFVGSYQHEKGNQGTLPSAASSSGIVAFPRVWTDAEASSHVSLYDQSSYSVAGQNLHRVTMEYAIESATGVGLRNRTAATDLYFDPNSHLLLHSVDAVTLNGPMHQTFIRVNTYGDYEQFSGVKIPTSIKQYLNGQLQWTLQLSQITINTAPPAHTFSF